MIGKQETIGRQPFVARLDENKGGQYPFLHVESGEGIKDIPVYSVREPAHHQLIVECVTSGKVVIFEAAGVMGFMVAVSSDPAKEDSNWKKFWNLKKGRDATEKVPIMLHPEDQEKLVDFDKLHSDYQYLKDSEKRRKFFGTLPFHAVLPIRDDAVINRQAFVTTPEDSRNKPADQSVIYPSTCIYFQGNDPVWSSIFKVVSPVNSNVHLGISSFNDHGEHSPYNFAELIEYVQKKQRTNFDFIVQDPLVDKYEIRSSHTQIQLPCKGESPEIKIFRKGPISADTIVRHTGHQVRVLKSAKFASRGYPENVRLDERVFQYLSEVNPQ